VFGRKYLIAAKEDLMKNGCKIPAMIEDPQTIFASMEAEKSTVAAPPPPPPPAAPPPPKPVTPAAVAEVLGTQSVVANAKKASNKVAAAMANRSKAAPAAESQADINNRELIRRGWDKLDKVTAQKQLQGFYYDLYQQLINGVKPEQRLLILPLTNDKYMVEAHSRSQSPSQSQSEINKRELVRRGWDKISVRDGMSKFSGDYYKLFLLLNGSTDPGPKLLALPLN
jgi:hypothetical protein